MLFFIGCKEEFSQIENVEKLNINNIIIIDDNEMDTKTQYEKNTIIITTNEIRNVLLHVRKLSIMRDLLEIYTDDYIREILLNRIEKEAIKLQTKLNLPNIPLFLPNRTKYFPANLKFSCITIINYSFRSR